LIDFLWKKSSDLNHTYFCIFQQKHGGHAVYVIEQTDQFQKFGKTLVRKYTFKKNQKN